MIITNKTHTIINYSVDPNYIKANHDRTSHTMSVSSHFDKIDNQSGKFSIVYEARFADKNTGAAFIYYKSLATMDFIIENESKDYDDLSSYQDEINALSLSFIEKNCLDYWKNLTITPFHIAIHYHYLREGGFAY